MPGGPPHAFTTQIPTMQAEGLLPAVDRDILRIRLAPPAPSSGHRGVPGGGPPHAFTTQIPTMQAKGLLPAVDRDTLRIRLAPPAPSSPQGPCIVTRLLGHELTQVQPFLASTLPLQKIILRGSSRTLPETVPGTSAELTTSPTDSGDNGRSFLPLRKIVVELGSPTTLDDNFKTLLPPPSLPGPNPAFQLACTRHRRQRPSQPSFRSHLSQDLNQGRTFNLPPRQRFHGRCCPTPIHRPALKQSRFLLRCRLRRHLRVHNACYSSSAQITNAVDINGHDA